MKSFNTDEGHLKSKRKEGPIKESVHQEHLTWEANKATCNATIESRASLVVPIALLKVCLTNNIDDQSILPITFMIKVCLTNNIDDQSILPITFMIKVCLTNNIDDQIILPITLIRARNSQKKYL